jgi:asparagine synthase (glutamine-hydrolysing)
MADAMIHRRPDNNGVWISEEMELAFAHRRLSIIDLSDNGNQPMYSENKRYVIVYNGEIYNHRELRRELLSCGRVFRGHSDTEVVLSGCEEWGIEQAISKCVGMFAIALWDVDNRELYLIRDRMGEKPLYYGWQKNTFIFSSELKAMKKHPDFQGDIDRNSLSLYFRHNYIPAPYSIYKGIYKLEPGTILKLSLGEASKKANTTDHDISRYWSLKEIVEDAESRQFDGSPVEAVNTLEALLVKSIEGQMIADVPLGAFLSGGTDSSTVVALMQRLSSKPVNTFCIGFNEQRHNEATYARQIAKHLGCLHTELYVTPSKAKDVIPTMPRLYDEPFADPSQIPTFLVSQLARKCVTVSLSGDAGDELFYGYNVYSLLFKRWNIARRVNINNRLMQDIILKLTHYVCNANKKQLAVIRGLLSSASYMDAYRSMMSVCHDPCRLVIDSREPATIFSDSDSQPNIHSKENAVMALDALSYLPDDILVKVDRAAMACSLETRIPLLDHRIVEFAFQLPFDIKFREGVGKWPLRQILYKYVPRKLVERPKKGFSIPLDQWLRDDLKEWAHDLLDKNTIEEDGMLNTDSVQEYLSGHMERRQDHSRIIWGMLMFQCWLHQD